MDEEHSQEHNKDSSIHVSSKYEDLVRSQMSQSTGALGDNIVIDQLDPSSLDGRRSPVGDDGGKQYEDGSVSIMHREKDNVYHMNGDTTIRKEPFSNSGALDDVERRSGLSNSPSLNGQAAQAVVEDVLGNGHARTPVYSTETPVYSRNGSAHSSTRQTPVFAETQDFTREQIRSDSLEKRLLDNLIEDSLTREKSPTQLQSGSRSGSERVTPQPEQIADVLNPADRHSPIRREYLVGSPRVSDHGFQRGTEHGSAQGSTHGSLRCSEHGSVPGSGHSSTRQTPQRDIISDALRSSQEKLYTGQDFRRSTERLNGSLSGGSSHGSRPQSLTSEQELTQYYELTSGGGGVVGSPGLPPVTAGNGGQGQRTGSASSLPAVGTQRTSLDKRSMTPDNHIRVPVTGPIIKSSLLPSRGMQRTPGSNASSRTVTPVNTAGDNPEVTQLQERCMDLENTVSNIRTLLASREKEVFELRGNLQEVKDVNRSLQEELDQRRARVSPGLQIAELERQYRDVVDERETLSAEVIRLREEIIKKEEERTSLNSYDPNGPQALQRKIDDLNSQIQDLQEANESAVDEIKAAENKIKQLAGDNETLRATQASSMRDLEDENRHFKHEISRLKEQTSHTEVSDYRLKIELQQVKEDNRGLRERNYQLHDDNIKLKEELDALRKSLESVGSNRKSFADDRHGARSMETHKSREPKLNSLDGSYHSELADRDYKTNDRDYKISERDYKTGDRDYKSSHIDYTISGKDYKSSERDYKRSERDYKTSDGDYKTSDRDYKTTEYLSELKRDVDNEKAREKHIYSYTTPGYESRSKYDAKHERVRAEKNYEEEYSTMESSTRYTSYRTMPDGRTAEKSPTRSQYEPRPLSPERPSALGPAKRDYYSSSHPLDRSNTSDRVTGEELARTKRERSRTSSAELDFRSVPLSAYSELSKTMPALSGRSRGSKTLTWEDETRLRIAPDHSSSSYTRGAPPTSVTRKHEETLSREDKGLDHRPTATYQDDGDASDTATDILVNAKPLESIPASTWNRSRPRRGSVGSDSSFDDIDDQLTAAARKRSKSADSREVLRRMTPTVVLSRSSSASPVKGEAGFRSVTPQPIPTQRNKSPLAISPATMSLTHGLRPFAPRSAADLQVNDVIKFSRQGGKLSQGIIKFIGHLPGRGDIYLGVELDKEDGKHDGTFEGIRYFKCKPSKGVFVAYNKVVMAWTA